MTPSMSTAWSTPRQLVSCTSSVLSCVMVKTKTRSKNSSSVETRSAASGAGSGGGAPLAALPVTEGVEERVARLGGTRLLAQGANRHHGLAHLVHVVRAPVAQLEVMLELLPICRRHHIFEIV